MPKNKNALLRLKILDELLQGGRRYVFAELLGKLNRELEYLGNPEVSERTLRGDLKLMREEFLAPLKARDGLYFYEDPDYSVFGSEIGKEEWLALYEALDILKPFKHIPIVPYLQNLVEAKRDYEHLAKNIYLPFLLLDHNPLFHGLKWMQTLYKALDENTKVHIDYDSFTGEYDFEDKVKPYFLMEHENRWFLIGKVEGAEEPFWTIPLDRIHSVKILDETFYPSEKDRAFEMLQDVVGVTYVAENPLEEVELYFRKPAADYVRTKPLHRSQEILENTPEGIRLKIRVKKNYELLQLLLKYVPNVRVIRPYALHRELMEMLEEGLRFMEKE